MWFFPSNSACECRALKLISFDIYLHWSSHEIAIWLKFHLQLMEFARGWDFNFISFELQLIVHNMQLNCARKEAILPIIYAAQYNVWWWIWKLNCNSRETRTIMENNRAITNYGNRNNVWQVKILILWKNFSKIFFISL